MSTTSSKVRTRFPSSMSNSKARRTAPKVSGLKKTGGSWYTGVSGLPKVSTIAELEAFSNVLPRGIARFVWTLIALRSCCERAMAMILSALDGCTDEGVVRLTECVWKYNTRLLVLRLDISTCEQAGINTEEPWIILKLQIYLTASSKEI